MSNLDELQRILSDLSKQYDNCIGAVTPLSCDSKTTDGSNTKSLTSVVNSESLSISDLQLGPEKETSNQTLPKTDSTLPTATGSFVLNAQPISSSTLGNSLPTSTPRPHSSTYPQFYSQLPYQQQLSSNISNATRARNRSFSFENNAGFYCTSEPNRESGFSQQIPGSYPLANYFQPKIPSYFAPQRVQSITDNSFYSTNSYSNTNLRTSEANIPSTLNPLYSYSGNGTTGLSFAASRASNPDMFTPNYGPQQTSRTLNSLQVNSPSSYGLVTESDPKSAVNNKRIVLGDEDILRLSRLIFKSSQVVKKCLESPRNMEYLSEVELKTVAIYLRQRYSLSAITPNVGKRHLIQIIAFVLGVDSVEKSNEPSLKRSEHKPSYILSNPPQSGANLKSIQLPTESELQLFNARYKPVPFLKSITRLWCQKVLYVDGAPAKGTYYSHSFTTRIPLPLFDASAPSPDNRRLVHVSIFSLETKRMWEASVLNQMIQLKINNSYVVLNKKQMSPGMQYFDITCFVEKALTSRTDSYLTITISVPKKFASQDIMVIHSLLLQSTDEITAKVYAQSIVQLQRAARKTLHITIPTKLSEVEKVLITLASNLEDAAHTTTKSSIEDEDIEMGDQIVSFICPLSLKKIQHPSKGRKCKHAQCFDAQTYIECNMDNTKWKCVVCNQELPVSEMIIDARFKKYLTNYPDLDRCLIHSDGSTAPLPQDSRKSRTSTPAVSESNGHDKQHKRSISEVIELSDEEIERPLNKKITTHPITSPNSSPEIIILD